MTSLDFDPLARAVVVRWLVDRSTGWNSTAARIAFGLVAGGVALSVLLSGWLRVVGLLVAALGVLAGAGLLVLRRILLALVGRIASRQEFDEHQDAVTKILDGADLPTTPLAAARFLFRLRRGVGPEVVRLRGLLAALDDAITDPLPDNP